jgi:glycosyltransferase involved in cell wall biosynthesis
MRIVHIEAGRHLYGGAAQVRGLVHGLAAARIDNVLICPSGSELAAAPLPARVIPRPICGDLDARSLFRFERVIRELAPDVVHVHSRRGADLWGGVAAALAHVPAVLTRRVDSSEPRALARLKFRSYARIVALSRAIETWLLACGVEARRLVRIPSAVDATLYRPDPTARTRLVAELGLPSETIVVGVVAQLIPRKGHGHLLAALPELVRRRPRIAVVFFGRGPLEARLRAEVAALGLYAQVRFAGFRVDLPALIAGLDMLVHPATREGLGVALLEAASCALPIVAAAAGGVVDVLEHERTALLVPPADAGALRAAVERLLHDRDLGRRLGAAARLEVERRFSIGALVAAHLELYDAVLRGARSRGPAVGAREPRSAAP